MHSQVLYCVIYAHNSIIYYCLLAVVDTDRKTISYCEKILHLLCEQLWRSFQQKSEKHLVARQCDFLGTSPSSAASSVRAPAASSVRAPVIFLWTILSLFSAIKHDGKFESFQITSVAFSHAPTMFIVHPEVVMQGQKRSQFIFINGSICITNKQKRRSQL